MDKWLLQLGKTERRSPAIWREKGSSNSIMAAPVAWRIRTIRLPGSLRILRVTQRRGAEESADSAGSGKYLSVFRLSRHQQLDLVPTTRSRDHTNMELAIVVQRLRRREQIRCSTRMQPRDVQVAGLLRAISSRILFNLVGGVTCKVRLIDCHQDRRPRRLSAPGRQPPIVISVDWPNGELRPIPCRPLVNSGSQSNFSRSHEHATHRSTCTRHPNDAAVPAPYLTRLRAQTYTKTYACCFEEPLAQSIKNLDSGQTHGRPLPMKKM
ncbi:hypothetical protein BLA14095_06165 [Burkholderia lata]|nr:hypothetical protein BLA14095_06165 [Burkholderia lata]